MKIKDSAGNVVPGLIRDASNGITVDNPAAYDSYLREYERVQKINTLEQQVAQLTQMVNTLMDKK